MLPVVAVGVAAFVAMLVLGAYAPDLRSGKNGGAHALSNAAVGFSGLVRLAEATGRNPTVVRADKLLDSEALVVLTPERANIDLSDVLARRESKPTLVVLPKWSTEAHEGKSGWVRSNGLLPPFQPEGVLAPANDFKIQRSKGAGTTLSATPDYDHMAIDFAAPRIVQAFRGDGVQPMLTDDRGASVLAKVGSGPLYVLSEPDLLNNRGMADQAQASAALALLDFLNSTDSGQILFDVTLNGLGQSRSPLRLAFDPPFLPVTVAIFAAMLLAGLQAANRFGAPRRPERAIAFGKAALVDNSASLIRKAGRETRLGGRYVDVIRSRAAKVFRLPPHLRGHELDERLEALNSESFTHLARATEQAGRRDELLAASRRLHQWLEEAKG